MQKDTNEKEDKNESNNDNKNENNKENSKIKFKIFLSTGGEFEITANSKDTFKSVFDEFIKSKNLQNSEDINTGICNGGIIQFDKNLEENNIKENNCVVLYSLKNDYTPNPDDINFCEKKEVEEKSDDLIIDEKFLEDIVLDELINFQSVLLDNINSNNNNKESDKTINDKKEKNENNNNQLIKVNHEHKLTFLYSNTDWNCKECSNQFNNKHAKYYCSLCDFNLCENCFTEKRMYPLKEFYHEQTKLQIYKFPIHEHKLIYCRTSRFDDRITQWVCDICEKNYNYKIWSFYCTNCDYDICLKCAIKYIPKDDLTSNIGIKTESHEHPLTYLMTDLDWICLICLQSFDKGIFPCYCCTFCDFYVCQDCIESLTDEEKYLFYNEGIKENVHEMKIKNEFHEHPLIYCMASKSREKEKWKCNKCNEIYDMDIWGFYCSLCHFSLCYKCYNETNKK